MKVTGTLRKSDLEGGMWTLQADSGETYQLVGKVDGVKDGAKAEIEGTVDRNAMGIGMVGPHLTVQRVRAL